MSQKSILLLIQCPDRSRETKEEPVTRELIFGLLEGRTLTRESNSEFTPRVSREENEREAVDGQWLTFPFPFVHHHPHDWPIMKREPSGGQASHGNIPAYHRREPKD